METGVIQRVQKMTSKGQITLPSKWRASVGTQHVIVKTKGKTLTVAPARFEKGEDSGNDTVIFSADRDNNGKGVPASEFIAILKKLVTEDEKARKTTKKTKPKR